MVNEEEIEINNLDNEEEIPSDPSTESVPHLRDEDEELSQEEIDAAIGKLQRRWFIPAAITGITAVLVLMVWFAGSRMRERTHIEEPSAEIIQPTMDTTAAESLTALHPEASGIAQIVGTGLPAGIPVIGEGEPQSSADEMFVAETVDSAAVEEPILPPLDDEFFRLLNAVVSYDDAEPLDDSTFTNFLMTPLARIPGALGIPGVPFIGDSMTVADMTADALAAQAELSSRIVSRLDSLSLSLLDVRTRLNRSEDRNIRLLERLERMTVVTDSLKEIEIKKLAKIVDVMKPEFAATMLKDKGNKDIKKILFKLKPRTAAKVLENFPPTKRAQIAAAIIKK
ncbi:hypothetical protein HQ587_02895 [bacterium]|nr:hypothetical protein [bacterium]